MSLSGLPCPSDGTHLRLHDARTATCPSCHRQYIITLSDAHTPPGTRWQDSDFASLISTIDALTAASRYRCVTRGDLGRWEHNAHKDHT